MRFTLAESLRLYPQPPILIRRALGPDTLPPGLGGPEGGYPIGMVGAGFGQQAGVSFWLVFMAFAMVWEFLYSCWMNAGHAVDGSCPVFVSHILVACHWQSKLLVNQSLAQTSDIAT